MWISARTATTLGAAALLLIMIAVAAPLVPRAHLPSLPEERTTAPAKATPVKADAPVLTAAKPGPAKGPAVKAAVAPVADKFGAAQAILDAPERTRVQRMARGASVLAGAARWGGFVGNGVASEPSSESVERLVGLLKDARTVADPRAERAEPAYVVRLVHEDHRVDVMVDPAHDRLVVARDGESVGTFSTAGLRKEYAALGDALSMTP